MSRSDTYRPTFLAEERRRELADQARLARLRADVLVVMQERLTAEAEGLARSGGLTAPQQRRFVDQVASAAEVSTLRGLAGDLAVATAPDRAAPRTSSVPGLVSAPEHSAAAPLAPTVLAPAATPPARSDRSQVPADRPEPAPAATPTPAALTLMPAPAAEAPTLAGAPTADRELVPAVVPRTASDATERWARAMAEVRFDVLEQRAKLASILRAAGGLGVDLGDVSDVRVDLDAALAAHEQRDLDVATGRLRTAGARLDALGDAIDEAFVQAEERARMVQAVEQTLSEMGCRVTGVTSAGQATVVQLDRPDGLVGQVRVAAHEGVVGCASSFDDVADAVAADHPAAGEPCARAGLASADFQRRLEAQPGIEVGQLETELRATRGAGASGRAAGTPRTPLTQPNPRTRSTR